MTKSIKKNIPDFSSYEEERKYWNTHSLADHKTELKRVNINVPPNLKLTFTVRLDKETINKLDKIAKKKGIGPRTLARMWLLEKLREEKNYSSL